MMSVSRIFTPLMKNLSDREREVLTARFGLENGTTLTLAALGKRYEVTRERIRQIEASALTSVGRNITDEPAAAEIVSKNKKFLASQGGVAGERAVFEFNRNLLEGLTEPYLALFLEASGPFYFHPEDKHFWPFYHLNSDVLKNVTVFVHQWSSLLKSKRKAVLAGTYEEELKAFVKKVGSPYEHAVNFLGISKKVGKNPFGDFGLAEWPEIHPKTVRDRIYLVMKKKGEPLHFQTIATMINESGFRGRKASAPTVHNELIKDKRFVLVGRGMYALSEYGYEPGTAREVIHRILRKNGPLKPREIIQAVEKERFFKSNTVLVNLQNKNFFRRLPDGTYKVREA